MNFKWEMTEENWRNYMHDNNLLEDETGEPSKDWKEGIYGQCFVGNLCAEFVHSLRYAFVNVYAYGVDDEYSETASGVPYALIDDKCYPVVPMQCVSFDDFKKAFEASFTAEILRDAFVTELAEKELADWE